MQVLIVDPDIAWAGRLVAAFRARGMSAEARHDGISALVAFHRDRPLLVVTELNVLNLSAYRLISGIHDNAGDRFPIIVVTVQRDDDTTLATYDAGAYDVQSKPINPAEVVARARAILRRLYPVDRGPHADRPRFTSDTLTVDDYDVYVRGQRVHLTPRERETLSYLVRQNNVPIATRNLASAIFGRCDQSALQSTRTLIWQLRGKLGHDLILNETVRPDVACYRLAV